MDRFIAAKYRGSTKEMLTLDTDALARYTDIIDLSIGDTDFITDEAVIDAAFRDAKRGYTRYGVPGGDPELKDAIVRFWNRNYGISPTAGPIGPDQLYVVTATCIGMTEVMLAMLDPGDEVIVLSPYFPIYKDQIEIAGGRAVIVELDAENGYSLDREKIGAAVTDRTKAIIFNNPTNPTGRYYRRDEMEVLRTLALEHDIAIVADEVYTDYIYTDDFQAIRNLPDMADHTITLNSFSKNFMMTGWRLGYIVADADFIKVIREINDAVMYAAPSISQRAAIKAMELHDEIREKYTKRFLERLRYATERIEKIPYFDLVKPEGTFYLFPSIKATGLSSREFAAKALEDAHVMLTGGQIFGPNGEGHIRIACTVGMDSLKEAFDRLESLRF